MRIKTSISVIGISAIVAACASSAAPKDPRFIDGFQPPAPAQGDTQIVMPIIRGIPAASEATMCTYIANPFNTEMDIVASAGLQSTFGHHLLLMDVGMQGTAGDVHPCADADMSHARFLGGATDAAQNFVVPDGIAVRVKAGGNLLIQSHWINTSTKPTDVQGVINLTAKPVDLARKPAQTFTVYSTQISIAAHQPGHVSTDCTFKSNIDFFLLAGHEHAWGTHVKIERVTPSATLNLYDKDWQPDYTSAPPRLMFTADKPLSFKAGDTMRVTCDFDNTTDKPIYFPNEMCVGFGMYFPATADIDCADGVWSQ